MFQSQRWLSYTGFIVQKYRMFTDFIKNIIIKNLFQGRQLFQIIFSPPSEKVSTLREKNLLPLAANSFLLESDELWYST